MYLTSFSVRLVCGPIPKKPFGARAPVVVAGGVVTAGGVVAFGGVVAAEAGVVVPCERRRTPPPTRARRRSAAASRRLKGVVESSGIVGT
jgi:hypothetical protein